MRKLTLLLCALLAGISLAVAQTSISGTVLSAENDEPVIGASILVKGANASTITDTDGKFTNFAVTDLFALAKDFENANDLDSSIYLSLADSLCDEWKIEDAIEMLKKAVRLNIDERSVCTSLFGIEVLNRFLEYQKQGYRFCPSSIDASVVKAGDTRAQVFERSEWSFGPYRCV